VLVGIAVRRGEDWRPVFERAAMAGADSTLSA